VKNLISEDSSLNYNKWVKGIADREFSAQKLMVNDIFNNDENEQSINKRRKENALPFPLSNLIPTLGNAIVSLQNSVNIIQTLKLNPIVKKESNNAHIETALKCLAAASDLIHSAAKSVDNIEVSL
jgi:hypothetical protein